MSDEENELDLSFLTQPNEEQVEAGLTQLINFQVDLRNRFIAGGFSETTAEALCLETYQMITFKIRSQEGGNGSKKK